MSVNGAVFVCGLDLRPGPRETCPDPLHDWPLPLGYVESGDVANARLRRGWANRRCHQCGLYGWAPGRIDPETDVQRGPEPGDSSTGGAS